MPVAGTRSPFDDGRTSRPGIAAVRAKRARSLPAILGSLGECVNITRVAPGSACGNDFRTPICHVRQSQTVALARPCRHDGHAIWHPFPLPRMSHPKTALVTGSLALLAVVGLIGVSPDRAAATHVCSDEFAAFMSPFDELEDSSTVAVEAVDQLEVLGDALDALVDEAAAIDQELLATEPYSLVWVQLVADLASKEDEISIAMDDVDTQFSAYESASDEQSEDADPLGPLEQDLQACGW